MWETKTPTIIRKKRKKEKEWNENKDGYDSLRIPFPFNIHNPQAHKPTMYDAHFDQFGFKCTQSTLQSLLFTHTRNENAILKNFFITQNQSNLTFLIIVLDIDYFSMLSVWCCLCSSDVVLFVSFVCTLYSCTYFVHSALDGTM